MRLLRMIFGAVIVIGFASFIFLMGYQYGLGKEAPVLQVLDEYTIDCPTLESYNDEEVIKLLEEIKNCTCEETVDVCVTSTPTETSTPELEATPTPQRSTSTPFPSNTPEPSATSPPKPTPTVQAEFCHCEQGEGEGAEGRKNCHPVKYTHGHSQHEWDYWSTDGTCDGWNH